MKENLDTALDMEVALQRIKSGIGRFDIVIHKTKEREVAAKTFMMYIKGLLVLLFLIYFVVSGYILFTVYGAKTDTGYLRTVFRNQTVSLKTSPVKMYDYEQWTDHENCDCARINQEKFYSCERYYSDLELIMEDDDGAILRSAPFRRRLQQLKNKCKEELMKYKSKTE